MRDFCFHKRCCISGQIYSPDWNTPKKEKKRKNFTIVFKAMDIRQWRRTIPGRWETAREGLCLIQLTALVEVPGCCAAKGISGESTAPWTPWVGMELIVQGNQDGSCSQDRAPEKKELHRETPLKIHRGAPWVLSRMLISACVWGKYLSQRKKWFESHKLPKLTQELGNLNSPMCVLTKFNT